MRTAAKPLSNPETIKQRFMAEADASAVLAGRSAWVDEAVIGAFNTHLSPQFPEGIALVAVGGFGRRELFPHSDVDLLLLVEREVQSDVQREALSAFLRTLWDNGLRLSQSVRDISDCCTLDGQNVELAISLLDQRFLAGDAVLHGALESRLPRFFESNRVALIRNLVELTRARHAKFQNTIYHQEPSVKEGPGGIRDLHVIHWLEKLRAPEFESSIQLEVARRFLFEVRCRLHYKFNRDANVLTFDTQEEIAADPGTWVREYYRHAREVQRRTERRIQSTEPLTESSLLRQFRDWRTRLSNADFTVSRERVFFRTPQQIAKDPELVLRLFAFIARHGINLSSEASRRITENASELGEYFATPRAVWPSIREILALPHAPMALRAMHDSGALAAIFPEWHEIDCLVVRDFYHRYTVDEHTLRAIESVASLRKPQDSARQRYANLFAETEDIPLLYFAMLFHDIGKGGGHEAHAVRSSELAAGALARIDAPPEAHRTVLTLIERHLDLSSVMVSRDLSDPATIRDLAERTGTIENLKLLTLFTYGDTDAVNPGALTPWRLEQLWSVYLKTHREFTRELETDRIHNSEYSGAAAAFLEGLPTRYLRTHSPDEVNLHVTLARQSEHAGVAMDLRRHEGVHVLTLVTKDRPGLFAGIAGSLASFGMNIVKAEAFANASGIVVDTFSFADPMRTLELNPAEIDRLKHTVQRVVLGKDDVRRLLKGRKPPSNRPKAYFTPTVTFDNESSPTATLVEIVAEDRPGLLYDLASTFSSAGCSIDVVLIDTESHKALDVFYVRKDGGKLGEPEEANLRSSLLEVSAGG
jgi:[protein-PII] uridylyltransferase